MKEFKDMKPMKCAGHKFMASGGFTGSSMPAGSSKVKSYVRKPPSAKPSKANFKRRAVLPGGLANGGAARTTSTEVALASGKYANGGNAQGAKSTKANFNRALATDKMLEQRNVARSPAPAQRAGGLVPYSKTPMIRAGVTGKKSQS